MEKIEKINEGQIKITFKEYAVTLFKSAFTRYGTPAPNIIWFHYGDQILVPHVNLYSDWQYYNKKPERFSIPNENNADAIYNISVQIKSIHFGSTIKIDWYFGDSLFELIEPIRKFLKIENPDKTLAN